ncbi:MAG: hypothetical protein ACOX6U_05995 [Oscillospiraceae bacterium]
MKGKTKLVVSIAVIGIFFAVTGALALFYQEPADPQPEADQGLSAHAAPLSQVVAYYEEQLDPEIPRIKVTARQFGDGCAVDYTLPYDGILRENGEKTQADQEQTWFLNLMNNFWSLPVLHDGYYETEKPTRFTIRFDQPPTGTIQITDYIIMDEHGKATEETLEYWTKRTYTFDADGSNFSFDLWKYEGLEIMSAHPFLRGLLLQCEIDGKQVEYYILFQTNYYGTKAFSDSDFNHLTPLKEVEK